jgi:hypothetical protein
MSTKSAVTGTSGPATPVRTKKGKDSVKAEPTEKVQLVTPVATKGRRDTNHVTPKTSGGKSSIRFDEEDIDNIDNIENLNQSNFVEDVVLSPSKSMISVDWKVEQVYKLVHKATGALGGNGYTGAIYGELSVRALQRVINILKDKCGLDSTKRMIDVGAGLGKPNLHAAQDPAVRLSLGVELEDIRWVVCSRIFECFTFCYFQHNLFFCF